MYSSFLIIIVIVATVSSEVLVHHHEEIYHGLFKNCTGGNETCLANAIQQALAVLGPGNEKLNTPPINPLEIKELNIPTGKSVLIGPQNFRNCQTTGLNTGEVKNAHLDLDKGELSFSHVIPKFIQKGQYTMKGNLSNTTLNGKGYHEAEFGNLGFKHTIKFTKETKYGETFLKVTSYDLQMTQPDYVHFNWENLHDGNPELSRKLNQQFNDQWKEIFVDAAPNYARGYGDILEKIAILVFERVPLKEFYDQ